MDVSVIRRTSELFSSYPYTVTHQGSTLYLDHNPSSKTITALHQFVGRRRRNRLSRFSAKVAGADASLFAKAQCLESLKSQLRVTLGRPKANGMYDWPVEELINTVEAHRRGACVSKIVGFGFTRSRLGVTKEFFLITGFIDKHVNGLEWLQERPEKVRCLVKRAFNLLRSLHEKGVTHMDFWAANLMLAEDTNDRSAKAIDLENCFQQNTCHLSETLGFQFGFFYHRELYRFITEADYDALVRDAIACYGDAIEIEKFDEVYRISKHVKVGRKERREIFLQGKLITG